jgi:CheY-like chemotaxis protein
VQATVQQPRRAPDGAPVHYERHRPEQTTLYRLVQQHAATFFAEAEAAAGACARDRLPGLPGTLHRGRCDQRRGHAGHARASSADRVDNADRTRRNRPRHPPAPQLILLDIDLPDIDGLEVLRRLKSDARVSHLPVVVVSSHAMGHEVQAALARGAADFLPKPLDLAALLLAIDIASNHHRLGAVAS